MTVSRAQVDNSSRSCIFLKVYADQLIIQLVAGSSLTYVRIDSLGRKSQCRTSISRSIDCFQTVNPLTSITFSYRGLKYTTPSRTRVVWRCPLTVLQLRLYFVSSRSHFFIMSESYYLYVKRQFQNLNTENVFVSSGKNDVLRRFWRCNLDRGLTVITLWWSFTAIHQTGQNFDRWINAWKMHSLQELQADRQLKLKFIEQRSWTNLTIFSFYCSYKRNTGAVKILLFSKLFFFVWCLV